MSDGDLTGVPMQDLMETLLSGVLTATIQKIVKEQTALVVGDVSEVPASTSRRSDVSATRCEAGSVERRSIKLGRKVVDRFDPDDPDTNIERWLQKTNQLRANARAARCPNPEALYNSFLAGLESYHGESEQTSVKLKLEKCSFL